MTNILSFLDAYEKQSDHPLRNAEIPEEYSLSIPLPTLRFGVPAYAGYSSPASRSPKNPTRQSPPAQWWLLDAVSGRLLLFAACRIYPFTDQTFAEFTHPVPALSMEEMEADWEQFTRLMEELAPLFLSGVDAEKQSRQALAEGFPKNFPEPLLLQYHALAPDFFTWLDK